VFTVPQRRARRDYKRWAREREACGTWLALKLAGLEAS
jgi:hypothetical protein